MLLSVALIQKKSFIYLYDAGSIFPTSLQAFPPVKIRFHLFTGIYKVFMPKSNRALPCFKHEKVYSHLYQVISLIYEFQRYYSPSVFNFTSAVNTYSLALVNQFQFHNYRKLLQEAGLNATQNFGWFVFGFFFVRASLVYKVINAAP